MALKHNKKRNIGLLNEFFARYMARAIIENRDGDLNKAKELFAKHFQPGTDINRELKVFRTLFETRLTTKEAAASLIEQAKQACKMQSQARLDLEKTALLHEVNQFLNDASFFDQEISEYRDYATIQVLMNHWRGDLVTESLSEAAQLEDKLINHLTRPAPLSENKDVLSMTNQEVDSLVVNLMTEKLNKKFSSALNEDQKSLLKLFVFSKDNQEAKARLTAMLEGIRAKAIQTLDNKLTSDPETKKAASKLQEVRSMLTEDYRDVSNPDDKVITFYMTVSKLEKELNNG